MVAYHWQPQRTRMPALCHCSAATLLSAAYRARAHRSFASPSGRTSGVGPSGLEAGRQAAAAGLPPCYASRVPRPGRPAPLRGHGSSPPRWDRPNALPAHHSGFRSPHARARFAAGTRCSASAVAAAGRNAGVAAARARRGCADQLHLHERASSIDFPSRTLSKSSGVETAHHLASYLHPSLLSPSLSPQNLSSPHTHPTRMLAG